MGKQDKMIQYYFYMYWAWKLRKRDHHMRDEQFSYPKCILDYLREILPNSIVGEVREDVYIYVASLSEFQMAVIN